MENTTETSVLAVQRQFWEALSNKDRDLFERVLAPDFIARSPGEPDQTRDTFIDTLTNFPGGISRVSSEGIEVHFFGEVAVLTGVQIAEISLPGGGSAIISRVMLTNVFREDEGNWWMVLSHAYETMSGNK